MHVDLVALDDLRCLEEASMAYFALRVQQLHTPSTSGVPNGVVFALFIVTHVVEGCRRGRPARG